MARSSLCGTNTPRKLGAAGLARKTGGSALRVRTRPAKKKRAERLGRIARRILKNAIGEKAKRASDPRPRGAAQHLHHELTIHREIEALEREMARGPHAVETCAKHMELRTDCAHVLGTPTLPGVEFRLAQREERVDVFFASAL